MCVPGTMHSVRDAKIILAPKELQLYGERWRKMLTHNCISNYLNAFGQIPRQSWMNLVVSMMKINKYDED